MAPATQRCTGGPDIGAEESDEATDPDMAAAIAVQERHTDALLLISGVVGTGIGRSEQTGRVVIQVYLEQATPELERAIPQELEGIPIEVVVTGAFETQSCSASASSQGTDRAGEREFDWVTGSLFEDE